MKFTESLRNCAHTGLALVQTRVALFSNELKQERLRFFYMLVALSLCILSMAILALCVTILVALLLEGSERLYVLGGIGLFFIGLGVISAISFLRIYRRKRNPFSVTLEELHKDFQCLSHPD